MKSMFLAYLLTFLQPTTDTNCCNANVVLSQTQAAVTVYRDCNRNDSIGFIMNDTLREDYFVGTIYQIKDGFAKVEGEYAISQESIPKGWVELRYISTYLVMDSQVPIYDNPNTNSGKTFIDFPEWYPVEILDCFQGWLYVNYRDNKQQKTGWLPPEFQCANPYTTCN